LCRSCIFQSYVASLRHKQKENSECRQGHFRKEQETCAKAYMMNDTTGENLAQGRADANRGGYGSEREIEAASAARPTMPRGMAQMEG
jgi:hypothetical protein